MDKRRVIEAPEGYAERVQLALRAAGRVADIARACGVSELYVYQARSGHRGWSEPAKLAAVAGVDERLLVYGPTEDLARALASRVVIASVPSPGDAAEYDRVIGTIAELDGSWWRARVNPVTLNMLKREHFARHGVGVGGMLVTPGGMYVFTSNMVEVGSSPSVPVGAVEAVPVVSP